MGILTNKSLLLMPPQFPRAPPRLLIWSFNNLFCWYQAMQARQFDMGCRVNQKEQVMTRRYVFWFLALGCLAFLGNMQGWLVEAGTISGGTAVTLGGLDSFANTVQAYLKGNVGKMLAMILAIAGIGMVVVGKMGLGISGLGAGIAVAFVPNIIGDAFDATAADPVAGVAPFVPWAAGDGVLDFLAQAGLVLLWPLLPVLKYGPDPVVWLALGIVVALRPTVVYQHLRQQVRQVAAGIQARAAGTLCRVG